MKILAVLVAGVMLSVGCGYHVSGRADLLPKHVRKIAIPAFANATSRYQLTQKLPQSITREFISRTRYEVVADPNTADAVLQGAITNYFSFPTVTDAELGRASGVQVIVVMEIRLTDRKSGAVLFNRPGMQVQNRYEISSDR